MRPLRLMTYNVRYFGHALRGIASTRGPKRGIAAAITGMDPPPDVICLQEVEDASLRANALFRRANPDHGQLESFMAELERAFSDAGRHFPYEALYFRAHRYGSARLPFYTTGLAILVNVHRLRVVGHNAHAPESVTHHGVAALKAAKQTRICAHVELIEEGKAHERFHVFNTHLSLPSPFARDYWTERDKMGYGANQVAEAKNLQRFIASHADGAPRIVCGDFNAMPGSPVHRYLTEECGLTDAQALFGQIDIGNPRRFPTAGFMQLRMHLDHLLSGGGVHWLDLDATAPFRDKSGAFHGFSDHVPIVGRFHLGAPPTQPAARP